MGKFRSKLKGQTKGKRWPKGQSSNSNPETRKHRDQAKSRFFQENLGPSNLTADALRTHDAISSSSLTIKDVQSVMESDAMEDESTQVSTYQTGASFASEWSQCSSMTFNRFLKIFRPNSVLHKNMLAVLAAIAQVIKENGGTESPSEYYCALITALEQLLNAEVPNEEQSVAILSLLNMGIKSVPEGVLKTSFGDVSQKLIQILKDYIDKDNNVIVKACLGVLSWLLSVQEPALWTNSSVSDVFMCILNPFSLHNKPKLRKAAQEGIKVIVCNNRYFKEQNVNPAADKVAEFCDLTLDTCLGGTSGEVLISSVKSSQTTILHVLALMKDAIGYFSKSHMKKSCETILRLMTLNYPLVTSCSLQVLHSLFLHDEVTVPAKLTVQLIGALYEYQPSMNDAQPTLAWMMVMQQSHVYLAKHDLKLASTCYPKVIATYVQLWLSEKTEVLSGVTYGLETLLKEGVSLMCSTAESVQENQSKLLKCFESIRSGLGYQYNRAWHYVLHVIKTNMEIAGSSCRDLLTPTLQALSELRDSYKFTYNTEVEHAVGAAVRSMGPEVVLDVIPLQKEDAFINMERSWLLPVLKENVKNSTLDFWIKRILPLAVASGQRAAKLAEQNDGIGAHSCELLSIQLWNLLPSFCNNPSDVGENFKSLAKTLGMAISEKKDLRLSVMASLRKLISHAKGKELEELARFDKNYLPILFNLYTTKPVGSDEEGQRLAAMETIKVYLTIANPQLTQQLFSHAQERLQSLNDSDVFVKESLLHLIRALIPYQNKEGIVTLFERNIKVIPTLTNPKDQKKSYKLLEEICGSNSDECKQFVKENRKIVQKLLIKSLGSSAVSSKGARLRCLNYLIKSQPHLRHDSILIKSALPEVVLACKDINSKTRSTAYALLNTIGEILVGHDETQEFLTMLVAGLVGSNQTICATVLALASVFYNFQRRLGSDNVEKLLSTIINLMMSPTREVVSSCLSFVKVYCRIDTTATCVPTIMKGLTSMTEDCKRHFRLKVRDILARFIRKFGCDSLMPHVPPTDAIMYKRLRNLRKLYARKKRKQGDEEEDEQNSDEEFKVPAKARTLEEILADSDEDPDDMETEVDKPKSKSQINTWIQEDLDDITDFTDPKVTHKITVSKPSNKQKLPEQKKKKDKGFKIAPDGRFIIEDNSSDSENDKKPSKLRDLSDSEDDNVSTAETILLSDKKRKRKDSSASVKSSVSAFSSSSSKYKAGGSGIHRPTSQETGSAFKGKKARGDIKKKGNVDPYAYLPLRRTALNKRKKQKLAGQYQHIVKAAKKGMKTKRKSKT